MNTDIAKHATVRELGAVFESAEQDIRIAFAMISAAQSRLNAAFTLGAQRHELRVDASYSGSADNFDDADRAIQRLTRNAWSTIVDRMDIQRMMSIKRWTDLQAELADEKKPLPQITEPNVHAFLRQYLTDMPTILTEAVQESTATSGTRSRA